MPLTSWPRYGLKRFARVYSVWILAVIALVGFDWAEKGHYDPQPAGRWIGNALMLQDWATAKPAVVCRPLYGDSPLWSLHYEWWFYMLFPAITLAGNRHSQVHAVGITAVVNSLVYGVVPNPLSRLLMYLAVWWIGVDASLHVRERGALRLSNLKASLLYVVATAVPGVVVCVLRWNEGALLRPGLHPVLEARHLLSSVVLVAIAFAWQSFHWVGFDRLLGLGSRLAPFSYSLYVIHYKSIAHAGYLSFLRAPVVEVVAYAAVTVLFCWFAEGVVYPRVKVLLKV